MFDRIAGVYDLMNTVMTAGLHHRWRARAAELARVGPGEPRAGRGHGHRRSGARAGAPRGARRARWSAATSPRRCSTRARAKAAAPRGALASSGPTRSRCPTTTGRFDAATVGFGARNFADLARGLAEMARVVRPGGRVVVLEITTPTRPPLASSTALVRPRRACSAGWRARSGAAARARRRDRSPTPTAYLPNSVRRFPGPARWPRRWSGAGLSDISYLLTAGGIIAIHVGTRWRALAPGPLVIARWRPLVAGCG